MYRNADGTRALKRWFKSQHGKFSGAVETLKAWDKAINGNPAVSKSVEVVRVYEVGKDWIERDWITDSVELSKAGAAAEPARKAAIEALRGSNGKIEIELRKKLENESANIHWSPSRGKLIVIDTQ